MASLSVDKLNEAVFCMSNIIRKYWGKKKYLEFEINILLFNHLSCKVIVTKGIITFERIVLHSELFF